MAEDGLTVRECLLGIVAKLKAVWPEREVFLDEIPQGAVGCFLARCAAQSARRELGRRRRRDYGFELCYFMENGSALDFHDWAETLYGAFETLEAGGGRFHCGDRTAEDPGGGRWLFRFSIAVRFLLEPEGTETMMRLDGEERIKDG